VKIITLSWSRDAGILEAFGRRVLVDCNVRNELNRRRVTHLRKDVVRTEPDDGTKPEPYMPRQFPLGMWRITGIIPHPDPKDRYLNPYFIATSAHQLVETWSLDAEGGYDKPTGRFVRDAGYGIHWPDPAFTTTTLGCGRVIKKTELLRLVSDIQAAAARGDMIQLAVS